MLVRNFGAVDTSSADNGEWPEVVQAQVLHRKASGRTCSNLSVLCALSSGNSMLLAKCCGVA